MMADVEGYEELRRIFIEVSKQRSQILNLAELHKQDSTRFIGYIERELNLPPEQKGDYFFAIGHLLNNFSYFELALSSWKYAADEYAKNGAKYQEVLCYSYIASIYYNAKDYPNSIKFNLRGSEIAREAKGELTEFKLLEAKCYSNIGNAFSALEDYRKAIDYFEKQLGIANEVGDMEEKQFSYKGLAKAYLYLEDYRKAIDYYEKALEINAVPIDDSKFYEDLGRAFKQEEDYRKAIDYYEKALEISKEQRDKRSEAIYNGSIGDIYYTLGDFENAISYLERELEIANNEIDSDREKLACYVSLSNAYFDYVTSISANIGYYPDKEALSKGIIEKTFQYHKKALELAREVGDEREESICHANLGRIFLFIFDDIPKAIQYYQKELELRKRLDDRLGESVCYGNLGIAHRIMKDYPKAIEFNKKSLQIAEELHDLESQRITNLDLGRIYYDDNKPETAYAYLKKSIELTEMLGERLIEEGYMISFYSHSPASSAYEYMILVCLNMKTREKKLEALKYVERSKSRAFVDMLATTPMRSTIRVTDELASLMKEEEGYLVKLRQKQTRHLRNRSIAVQPGEIDRILEGLKQVYDKIENIDQEYVLMRRGAPISFDEIKPLLLSFDNTEP
jgi:tetratricopeptide (TPR) repeat protein